MHYEADENGYRVTKMLSEVQNKISKLFFFRDEIMISEMIIKIRSLLKGVKMFLHTVEKSEFLFQNISGLGLFENISVDYLDI